MATATADARPLRVLATGDSMMLLTDRLLKEAMPGAAVRSDVHVATGLTQPELLDWAKLAQRQAATRKPDVVVTALGANDGWPIRGAKCCGAKWTARYATRARRLMRAWTRNRHTRVYWLTLPAPNDVALARQFDAVNVAVVQAASAVPAVTIVDIRPVITPTGGYQPRMAIDGVDQQIRSDDGVHLWWPGARLATEAIVDRMRLDGLV
jgi:hypothetical protein